MAYVEKEMNLKRTFVEYKVTQPTTNFALPFEFVEAEQNLRVRLNGIDIKDLGYSFLVTNNMTVQMTPTIPHGTLRISRETDIDKNLYKFTAGALFEAHTMDKNFEQIRHSQQEVRDGFEKLSDDTYVIIDTLQDVEQAAQDAADAAKKAAQLANDAAERVNDKVSQVEIDYIHENGAALPYNEGIAYKEGAVAVKDGVLQQWNGGKWIDVSSQEVKRYLLAQQEINNDQALTNNELYIYKQPVIYASELKTDGTDQLSLLNAYAQDAVAKKMTLVLPSGVISIADEFIPPDNLTMRGVVDSVTNAGSATVLKWIGADGTNKAVLRCSKKAIGVTPLSDDAVSRVNIDIVIDAAGCDYGAYFRYFTNESTASVLAKNSTKCGIMILQCWFSAFPKLIALSNKRVGISVGLPLSGEMGDTDVNAINFGYIRAHNNGVASRYLDTTKDIRKGCGLMIRSRACSYTSIQSESNYGVGMIEDSYLRNNFYGAIYLENNCKTSNTEDIGLLNYGTHTSIQSLYLAVGAKVRNAVSDVLRIQNATKDEAASGISLSSIGKIAYYGTNYNLLGYLSASDYARLVYSDVRVIKDIGVANIKYNSNKPFPTTDFYVFALSSVCAVFVPKISATLTKTLVFYIDDVYIELNIVNPVAGVPISIRFPSFLAKGKHTFRLGDAATSANFECDCYLVCGVLPSGSPAESFEM